MCSPFEYDRNLVALLKAELLKTCLFRLYLETSEQIYCHAKMKPFRLTLKKHKTIRKNEKTVSH